MKKEEIESILLKVKSGTYIRIDFDLGVLEGKIFKDKSFGTMLMYGEGLGLIDLNFKDFEEDVPCVEGIFTGMEKIN